jgi:hypothetical protein
LVNLARQLPLYEAVDCCFVNKLTDRALSRLGVAFLLLCRLLCRAV